MNDKEHEQLRQLYALQVELFYQQGEEIKGLRIAQEALEKSHEIMGKSLELIGKLSGYSDGR